MRPHPSGGLAHLDSNGTVLGFKHETMNSWAYPHLIINPLNDTFCWMYGTEYDQLDGLPLRCAPLANLNNSWDLPEPRLPTPHSVVGLGFDGVNQNWYLTFVVKERTPDKSGRSYVCSYLFDRCLRLDEFDLDEENSFVFVVYDIPNRLMFRVTYNVRDNYSEEMQGLTSSSSAAGRIWKALAGLMDE